MKILLYSDEFAPMVGGIATYSYEVATALQKLSGDVTMLAPNYNQDTKEIDEKMGFKVIRYDGDIFKYYDLPSLSYKFIKYAKEYDLIHGLTYYSLFPIWISSLLSKVRFFATLHGTDILTMNLIKLNKIISPNKIFSKCEQITTSSSVIRNLFIDRFPDIDHKKVTAFHYGINDFWRGKVSDSVVKDFFKEFHYLAGKKIVLTVARLDDRKGHEFVIEALSGLPEKSKEEIAYVVIGRGDENYKQILKTSAQKGNIDLHILENISNDVLKVFYAVSSVFCMPGKICKDKIEGLGLVYLEAAAQALPSISFRIGGVTDVIHHQKNGLLSDAHDVEDLRKNLNDILFDDDLRSVLSENALKGSHEFTWENYVTKLYNF